MCVCVSDTIEIQSLTSCSSQSAPVQEHLRSWFHMNRRERSVFERWDLADICRSALLCVLPSDESLRQKPQSKQAADNCCCSSPAVCHWFHRFLIAGWWGFILTAPQDARHMKVNNPRDFVSACVCVRAFHMPFLSFHWLKSPLDHLMHPDRFMPLSWF